jgi:hypothetical protein
MVPGMVPGQRQLGPYFQQPDPRFSTQNMTAAQAALNRIAGNWNNFKIPTRAARDQVEQQLGGRSAMDFAREAAPLMFANGTPMLTEQQLTDFQSMPELAALAGDWLTGPNRATSFRDLQGMATGYPDETGYVNPMASQAYQNAMQLAGSDLIAQGYKLDPAEVEAQIIGTKGLTLENYGREQAGQPSVEDQIQQEQQAAQDAEQQDWTNLSRQHEMAGWTTADTAEQTKQAEDQVDQYIVQQTGQTPSQLGLERQQVIEVLNDPAGTYKKLAKVLLDNDVRTKAEALDVLITKGHLDPSDPTHVALIQMLTSVYGG